MRHHVWKLAQLFTVAALWLVLGAVTLAGPEDATALRSAAGLFALGGLLTVLLAAAVGILDAITRGNDAIGAASVTPDPE